MSEYEGITKMDFALLSQSGFGRSKIDKKDIKYTDPKVLAETQLDIKKGDYKLSQEFIDELKKDYPIQIYNLNLLIGALYVKNTFSTSNTPTEVINYFKTFMINHNNIHEFSPFDIIRYYRIVGGKIKLQETKKISVIQEPVKKIAKRRF